MACEETTQLLSQFIDDVLSTPARAAVDEHLDRCPVCSVGSLASVVLFFSMFVGLSPHFMALQRAARQMETVLVFRASRGYDLNQPVTSEDFSAMRAPFAEQSPSLNPGGALAAL